jgi:putative inorganic carbon (hco3(-)) transporter
MEAGGHVSPPLGLKAEGPAGFSSRAWFAWAVLLAAGAGVLAATHPRLALDLALLVLGMIAVLRWPLAVLLVVLAIATRHSPFVEILTASSCVVLLPRLFHAPGKALLFPLAAFLLFALPGINFGGSQLSLAAGHLLVIPGLNWEFLTRPSPELLAWIRVAYAFGLALLAALTITNVRRARLVFGTVVVAGAYPVLVGVSQLVSGTYTSKGGFNAVQGPFDFPNEFGFYLVIVLVLSVVALFEVKRPWLRLGGALLVLGTLVTLQHTYTRGAWIGFALAFLVLALAHYRRLIVVALIALALALVAAPSAVESVQARFGDLASQNASNSKNSLKWRRGEWGRMTHFGDEKPLTGQGFGSYQRLTVKEFGYQDGSFSTLQTSPNGGITSVGFAAHNDYVKLYVETGVPGLLLWVAVLAGLIVSALSAARVPELRPWAIAVASLGVAFALMSASDNIQGYAVPVAILFALTGALAGAQRGTARASRPPAG